MPGAVLPNTGIILPALGGDSGDWDDILNAALTNYDEHDHTAGNGVRITVAALDIDDDLSVDGNALEDVGKLEFQAIAALAAGAVTLYVSDADDELYWRTNAGVNVKLTNGASINTSLIGGIGGDYSTVSAEIAFDDGDDRYTFKQNNATGWARLAAGSVRIYETGTSETVYVSFNTPTALAASYDITLPTALPASTAFLMTDAAGQLAFTTSPVLASNASVTVSGTGRYRHDTWIKTQAFVPHVTTAGSFTTGSDGAGGFTSCLLAASSIVYAAVQGLIQFEKVTAIRVQGQRISGAGSMTYDVYYVRPSAGAGLTSLLSAPVTSSDDTVTLTLAGTFNVSAGDAVYVMASCPAATTHSLYSLQADFEVS